MDKLGKLGIVHVVIDEAHSVSEWGESFRPSYLQIGEIIRAAAGNADTNKGLPLVTAFTATASTPVLNNIQKYIFGGVDAHRIIGNPDRSNIRYAARGCILRDLTVRDLLIKHQRPAIVFCSSRNGTEKLARYLRNELEAEFSWAREIRFYHAGLSREEKTGVEQWFFSNTNAVLLATCAYGMGVDKADIRTVIHRDCPPSVEAYLQESGRAGRDGKASQAILLWGPDDALSMKRAQNDADKLRLEALFRYGRNTAGCRREALLHLLNYETSGPGGGDTPESDCCDVCDHTASEKMRETESVLGFFRKNRRAYTPEEAIPVLAGAESLHWSEEDVKGTIRRLLRTGQLKKIRHFPWKNKITVPRTNGSPTEGSPHSPRPSSPVSSVTLSAFFSFLGLPALGALGRAVR
jgi:ATP-dependent DNA helicase RecQ